RLVDVVFGPTRPVLWLLTAAVFLVLLVACVNVANLLLARGAARAREVAVRTALGAGFSRLGRQFLTEALLLALAGAVVGVGFAYGGLALLVALAPNDIPRLGEVGIDGRVLAVTLAVTVAVGGGFGLVPTLQAAGLDVLGLVRAEGRGLTAGRTRRRGRDALVVAELALSVVLVVGAGLLIRSFQTVLAVHPGFEAAGVLKAQYQLPATRYPRDFSRFPDWTEIQAFHAGVLERARRVPGVESVAIAAAHPLDAGFTNSFLIVGREAEARDWPEITVRGVSADYFATMGVAIQRGRGFDGTDQPRSPAVALINEEAATRFFADRDPLGQEISFWGIRRRIVGVVGNERVRGLTEPAPPAVYVAITQVPPSDGVVLVKTADPARLGPAIRAAVAAGDPALSVFGVEPLARTMSDSVAQRRFAMMVLGAFAAVGLALALIGVYGVVTYTTSLRLRELGIRAALGAGRGEVVSLVVGEGGRLAAAGIALGWLGALAVSRLLTSLLYGVSTVDPLTFGLVPLLVLLAAIAATWVPAWRAGRVSPVEALRLE
ncbi:MAG: FtsX-like permease family protein, partial [Gemmatimonadales bacterium]|nr:FtsX-like permease family protein [Gemmatimonadales bacterium]